MVARMSVPEAVFSIWANAFDAVVRGMEDLRTVVLRMERSM